jgi:hypothetical protein
MSFQSSKLFSSAVTFGENEEGKSESFFSRLKEFSRSERERGLWSFLTWSFFLASFLTAAEIESGAAHAGTTDATPLDGHASGDGSAASPAATMTDVQHAALESGSVDHAAIPADARVAMHAVNLATGALPQLADVDPLAGAQGPTSTAGVGYVDGDSGSTSITNNYYSSDSHDTTNIINNDYVTIDSHDTITTVVNVVNTTVTTVVDEVEHVVDGVGPVVGAVVDPVVHAVEPVVAAVGDIVGGATQTVDALLDTTLHTLTSTVTDTVPTLIADVSDTLSGLTPVVGTVVDTTLHTVTSAVTDTVPAIVADLGGAVSSVVPIVDGLAETTLHTLTSTVTDTVPTLVADVSDTLSGLTPVVGTVVDTTLHTVTSAVTDTVPTVVSSLESLGGNVLPIANSLAETPHIVTDTVPNLLAAAGDTLNFGSATNPVASLVEHDNPITSLLTSDAHGDGGTPLDLVHNVMSGIGASSSGSLTFAAATPEALDAHDNAPSGHGYAQFNLAVQDVSDAGATATPTDTGGITSIITSAIGLGPHHANSDTSSSDHTSDTSPVHLTTILDDLHTHHLGLFG